MAKLEPGKAYEIRYGNSKKVLKVHCVELSVRYASDVAILSTRRWKPVGGDTLVAKEDLITVLREIPLPPSRGKTNGNGER